MKNKLDSIITKATGEQRFFTNDGKVLADLKETHEFLKTTDNGTFSYHVNKEKNDFHNWIKNSLQDNKLAGNIKRIKTKKTMIKKIEDRMKELGHIS